MLGLSFYLSHLPSDDVPLFDFPFVDKWAHLVLYAGIGFSLCRTFTFKQRYEVSFKNYFHAIGITTFLCFVWGLLDEWHQSFVPGRYVEVADLIADILGGFLGGLLTVFYRRQLVKILAR